MAGLTLAGLGVPAAAFLAGGGQQEPGPSVTPAIDTFMMQHDLSAGNAPGARPVAVQAAPGARPAPTPSAVAPTQSAVAPTQSAASPVFGALSAAGAAVASARAAAALTRVAAASTRVAAAATGVSGGNRPGSPAGHPRRGSVSSGLQAPAGSWRSLPRQLTRRLFG